MPVSTYDSGVYDTAVYDGVSVGDPKVELLLDDVWTDITSYVRVADGITIVRGRGDWSGTPQSATCTLTLDNADGRFTPRNSSGPYYGSIGRNTQIRVSVWIDDGTTTVRFWGDVSEWPASWDLSGTDVTVQIVASGVRRALGVGASALESPYRRAMSRQTDLVAYWPLEDGADASSFGSTATNVKPGAFSGGVTLASDVDTFAAASDALPVLSGDPAAVTFTVPYYTPDATGTVVRCLIKSTSGTTACGFDLVAKTSTGLQFVLEYLPFDQTLSRSVLDSTGAVLDGPRTASSFTDPAEGCRLSLEMNTSGSDVQYGYVTLLPGETTGLASSLVTLSGQTLGYVTSVTIRHGSTPPGESDIETVVGHVSVESTKPSIFDLKLALTGNAGEAADERMVRLATEQGVALTAIFRTGHVAELMGPQGRGSFLDQIDECAEVDGGSLCEAVTTRSLFYYTRQALYDPAIGLTLTYTQQRFDALEPVDDDQLIANDVTVSRPGGSSARYQVTTGNLSIDTIGDYAQDLELNVYSDDQLPYQASWRAGLGTQDFPRWVTIGLDARNNLTSGHRTNLIALREGGVITLASLPTQANAGQSFADVQITGWTEQITPGRWRFDLTGVPADLITHVFILDSATKGILDRDRLAL